MSCSSPTNLACANISFTSARLSFSLAISFATRLYSEALNGSLPSASSRCRASSSNREVMDTTFANPSSGTAPTTIFVFNPSPWMRRKTCCASGRPDILATSRAMVFFKSPDVTASSRSPSSLGEAVAFSSAIRPGMFLAVSVNAALAPGSSTHFADSFTSCCRERLPGSLLKKDIKASVPSFSDTPSP